MAQYCRYCNHAFDYNGEGTDYLCMAMADCGNKGAGQFYPASKAKRVNRCKYYEFNGRDIFDLDREYQPRVIREEKDFEQLKLW